MNNNAGFFAHNNVARVSGAVHPGWNQGTHVEFADDYRTGRVRGWNGCGRGWLLEYEVQVYVCR